MVDDTRPDRSKWPESLGVSVRRWSPLVLALALVGTALGGLLVGYEPVGNDPDRLYRPLKHELARELRKGRLPFWSTRFGLGIPLIAESHVAAFYPANLVLYRVFDVPGAYRLSMWIHYVALVATTYLYSRCLGISAWGGALAGVTFTLCGFQAIHSGHEPFYCLMPYLPLALMITECYMSRGRMIALAFLALCLGIQWTLGHFQLQMWTGGLVILTGLWRAGFNRRLWARALGVIAATLCGAALSAMQLGLSWQFARTVGQTDRSPDDLQFYSFPPLHWFELVLPRLLRDLRLGPEDPYWLGQQTWGHEAALYVGAIPLIFAFIGALGRPGSRSGALWRILVPLGFALATMPRWWPHGYLQLLALPGLGYFRVPARYTLLTSFGLAILAAEGFDIAISKPRFRLGLVGALVFAGCGTTFAFFWTNRPDVHIRSFWFGTTGEFIWGGLTWLLAIAIVAAWRCRRLPAWVPVAVAGIELGILFYTGPTRWNWAVAFPSQSPVFSELIGRTPTGLIGGEVENLPVRAGFATANPHIGFAHTYPNKVILLMQQTLLYQDTFLAPSDAAAAVIKLWMRRCRVEYLVSSQRSVAALGPELGRWEDPALDQLVHHKGIDPPHRLWSIIKLDEPAPEVHVARRAETVTNRVDLIGRLSVREERDLAMFLAEDRVAARRAAQSARLVSWDGSTATVDHVGACDLVIARTFDTGWLARVGDGPEQCVLPVDGGFQAVRLEGSGTHRVTLRYQPPRLMLYSVISLIALALIVGIIAASFVARARSAMRGQGPRPAVR